MRPLAVMLLCVLALPGYGVVNYEQRLEIDFTDADTAAEKGTWSEFLTITPNGLGWSGDSTRFQAGWFQTKMVALGEAWRPTSYARFCVNIEATEATRSLKNLFVRYSPDAKHWSCWQALQKGTSENCPQYVNANFHGNIEIPLVEREQYRKYLRAYSELDVPWGLDEAAAVEWIIGNDPDFFAKQLPIMGYVEFRFEGLLYGGQRIKSFEAVICYSLSGLFTPSKEPNYMEKFSRPWSYRAREPIPQDD